MTPKTNDQNILFLNERISFNLHCSFNDVVSNYKSLLILITTSE